MLALNPYFRVKLKFIIKTNNIRPINITCKKITFIKINISMGKPSIFKKIKHTSYM